MLKQATQGMPKGFESYSDKISCMFQNSRRVIDGMFGRANDGVPSATSKCMISYPSQCERRHRYMIRSKARLVLIKKILDEKTS